MPNKLTSVLIVVFVVVGIWGLSQMDWEREVPPCPPNMPYGPGSVLPVVQPDLDTIPDPEPEAPKPGEPAKPGPDDPDPQPEPPKPAPQKPTPPRPEPPKPAESPVKLPAGIVLAKAAAQHAVALPKSNSVVITIESDGTLRSGGVELGAFSMVKERVSYAPGATAVILPHRDTPWKNVHWALLAALEGGAGKLGVGVMVKGRPAMIEFPMSKKPTAVPADAEELKITVGATDGGEITYQVWEFPVADLEQLAAKISELNTE